MFLAKTSLFQFKYPSLPAFVFLSLETSHFLFFPVLQPPPPFPTLNFLLFSYIFLTFPGKFSKAPRVFQIFFLCAVQMETKKGYVELMFNQGLLTCACGTLLTLLASLDTLQAQLFSPQALLHLLIATQGENQESYLGGHESEAVDAEGDGDEDNDNDDDGGYGEGDEEDPSDENGGADQGNNPNDANGNSKKGTEGGGNGAGEEDGEEEEENDNDDSGYDDVPEEGDEDDEDNEGVDEEEKEIIEDKEPEDEEDEEDEEESVQPPKKRKK